ncbi:MAG: hypothetical protein JWL96_1185 [Sphingomonas bacterium]|nr:hypothetical protein [Sphingomonas bacterium]
MARFFQGEAGDAIFPRRKPVGCAYNMAYHAAARLCD